MASGGQIDQGMHQLVLAPPGRRDAIVRVLRSARRTIALSIFRCDDFTIVDELAVAIQRGVAVRILLTRRARGWKKRLEDLTAVLRNLGADVRRYESSAMKYHAKYIVVDDGPALVTSLNFTRKCFESTRDFLVFSEDPDVITSLKTLFDHDCNSPAAPMPAMSGRLIVAPENARRQLTEHLASARSSIQILDHRVTDPEMLALLRDKRSHGVAVRVIGDSRVEDLIPHGRMILIDRRTAVVGSIHLSTASLDSRRELALIIEETPVVTELYDYFETLARNEVDMNLWSIGVSAAEDADDEDEDDE